MGVIRFGYVKTIHEQQVDATECDELKIGSFSLSVPPLFICNIREK